MKKTILVKPSVTPRQFTKMSTFMPQVDEILSRAGQDGPCTEEILKLVAGRATYRWLRGEMQEAIEDYKTAVSMCDRLYGEEHATTILTKARLQAAIDEWAGSVN